MIDTAMNGLIIIEIITVAFFILGCISFCVCSLIEKCFNSMKRKKTDQVMAVFTNYTQRTDLYVDPYLPPDCTRSIHG